MKRFILALTEAEIGALRSLASIQLETGDAIGHGAAGGAWMRALRSSVDKIDQAQKSPISDLDWRALDYASGDLIDNPDGVQMLRQSKVRGNPGRARSTIGKAMRAGARARKP